MHPLPKFERERVKALRATHILDSDPAPDFDAIVQLARDLFEVPICLVSLVDEDRQWFKAKCGLEIAGTSRDGAFCSHTILSPELLVVEDATQDPRFATNPLVSGEPGIRYYAGAPLMLEPGIALGSLCLVDFKPRHLTDQDAVVLERLAAIVVGLIRGHALSVDAMRLQKDVETQRAIVEGQTRELSLRARRFAQTERMAGIGAWELDLATEIVTWSDETYRICGVPLGTLVDLELAASIYPERERTRLHGLIARAVREDMGYDSEFEIVTPDGTHKWVRAVGEIERLEGVPRRLFGTFQDISERHRTETRMWDAANRDTLTGLANRFRFNDLLPQAFVGPGHPGLLMVDADQLKDVNDTLGHAAGDALLCTIGFRLEAATGDAGTVARLSGDEFAVVVKAPASLQTLTALAERILDAMRPSFTFQGSTITPRVSLGGAIGTCAENIELLCQEADLALHRAKEKAPGAYVPFHADLKSAITARVAALNTVDEALSRGDVLAWYQPIVDLATGHVTAFEALARVRRGDTIQSIGAFADVLQDPRIATRLTSRILHSIETDILAWKAQGLEVPRIALNAGSADFQSGRFESLILETCKRAGIAPAQLAVEVTETVFLSRDADIVSRTAERLRAHGIIIALDDFGTGYASLAHLGSFPVDVIKIDRSFVAQITQAGPPSVISSALIDLGQRLNIRVVAEGVETDAQLERLVRLRCDRVQGYLVSRALPPTDVPAFLWNFVYHWPKWRS